MLTAIVDLSTKYSSAVISRESSFCYKISQLHRLIRLRTGTALEPLGIGACQVPFVAELFQREGQSQNELSAQLHIDKAATARALAKLEKAGFVERRVNPTNRREKLIFLTAKSKRLRDEVMAPLHGVTEILAHGFSDREKHLALTLLERMLANLGEPGRENTQ